MSDVAETHNERISPPREAAGRAILADPLRLLESAATEGPLFWERHARTLSWTKPWSQVLQSASSRHEWFVGGRINASYNALDRHVLAGRGNLPCLTWLGEVGEQTRDFTYAEALEEVCRIAAMLSGLGVAKGDRVVIYMPLTPEGVFAMLACARLGAVHVTVYPGMGEASLRSRIEDCGAKALLYADITHRQGRVIPLTPIVLQALDGLGDSPSITAVSFRRTAQPLPPGHLDWGSLTANAPPVFAPADTAADDPLFILYTSGTTGRPKGIVHVHGGYTVGVDWFARNYFEIGPDSGPWFSTSDIGWVVGHSYIAYGPFFAGGRQIIREGAPDYPDLGAVWRLVDRFGVTGMFTAPTLLRMYMRAGPDCLSGTSRQSLRFIACAGEPLNPEALRWTSDNILSDAPGQPPFGHVLDNFWQTEVASPLIGTFTATDAKPGRAGLAMPTVRTRIVDADGNDVAVGEAGSLIIQEPLPYMMRTVWNDEARYESVWSRVLGGYVTGDLAAQDADGYISLLGRTDDVLNVAGHRIGTAEIESSLVGHAAVAECAAIGVPDAIKGETIKAFVALRHGPQPSSDLKQELLDHVRAELGPIARPSSLQFVDFLPKTRSGKILRRLLRARELGLPEGDLSTLDAPAGTASNLKDSIQMPHDLRPSAAKFRALVVDQTADKSGVFIESREVSTDDLPGGEVTVAVSHSSLNYKDGMVLNGVGRLVRTYPHVPGIDYAGVVQTSEDPRFNPGDQVVLTGWRVGEHYWGGYAERARAKGDWLVHLPTGLSPAQAMAIGTAGLTAMLCLMELEDHGLRPDADLPVLVTGAAGGVGSVAVALLAARGYRVLASTGRESLHDYLKALGANGIVGRDELSGGARRPLDTERWSGVIDTVGGQTLAGALSHLRYGCAVAACGLAGGDQIQTTIIPFLLRGVKLLGVDSVVCPTERRTVAWKRLARELPLEKLDAITQTASLGDLPALAAQILKGQIRGRVVVEVGF